MGGAGRLGRDVEWFKEKSQISRVKLYTYGLVSKTVKFINPCKQIGILVSMGVGKNE
ncbi:MAG: hypothetical protein QXQ93_07050 [Ignisphaera sp.]